jgi:hypothetical protein
LSLELLFDWSEAYWQRCEFGKYSNSVEILGLAGDPIHQTVSFEWKPFLNDFFRYYTYVWYHPRKDMAPAIAVDMSLGWEIAMTDFAQIFDVQKPIRLSRLRKWRDNFGCEHDSFFEQAHVDRVKKAHTKPVRILRLRMSKEDSTEEDFAKELRRRVNYRRRDQNTSLLD